MCSGQSLGEEAGTANSGSVLLEAAASAFSRPWSTPSLGGSSVWGRPSQPMDGQRNCFLQLEKEIKQA